MKNFHKKLIYQFIFRLYNSTYIIILKKEYLLIIKNTNTINNLIKQNMNTKYLLYKYYIIFV